MTQAHHSSQPPAGDAPKNAGEGASLFQAVLRPSLAPWDDTSARARGVPLDTLILLRWLAVAGQSIAVLLCAFVLRLDIALVPCLVAIMASAALNLFAQARLKRPHARASERSTALQIGFDITQLGVLLGLTGGLDNPFALLLIAPVTVAAATLSGRSAFLLGALALLIGLLLFFFSLPLPWAAGVRIEMPPLYRFGMLSALSVGVIFTGGYAWRVALEAERTERALAAMRAVLAREQKLTALGGLAASAAHELGTPLATMQVVAREMLREARRNPHDSSVAEDAALLLQQAERCRDILRRLSSRPEDGDMVHGRMSLEQILEEVTQSHRGLDVEIVTRIEGEGEAPVLMRQPEIIHSLSALLENAVGFARERVELIARFDEQSLRLDVLDDGPGFAVDILPRLGEPYVSSRARGETGYEGMGLGLFIARTLLERTGARLDFRNRARGGLGDGGGAEVRVRWRRSDIEAREADVADDTLPG
ncbi:MAG: ActS/PrrB/RegB family redox-sensitive histidine kinase [Brevundimonas sp.]|jgi:two-component system, sensor histidine kinase RegB|uniref:ActS/PrrB/RegB family redox-sensitive histidine kinase n=1 Tax=Brevundimonas sp. TaxID=1871086 RepID=UPI00391BCC99